MRALKAVVIVMGVLILAGMGLVGYGIVKRATTPQAPAKVGVMALAPPIAGSAAKGPYGPVEIPLPPGARLLGTRAEGDRLLVELALANGGERVLVIELASGALLGTIDLKPQP